MFNFDFTYDAINLILFVAMIWVGKIVSKRKNYWGPCFIIIVMFTLIEGARYGRGVDYLHYLDVFNYNLEDNQVLFTSINNFLKLLGVTAEGAFFFYAFPFIWGGLTLMKPTRKYAMYMFPLFLMSTIVIHESFPRQAFSLSFVFFYLAKLNNILENFPHKKIMIKQWAELFILALVAYSIHSIAIVGIFVSTLALIFLKRPFPWIFSVPILLLGKFVISKSFDFSYLNGLLQFLGSSNEKFSGYVDNADMWFSADAMNDAYNRNIIIELLETFGCCSLAYLGYKLLHKAKDTQNNINEQVKSGAILLGNHYNLYVSLFNISIIGLVILETFYDLEIVRRVAYCWSIFWFVPVSLILYYRKSKIFSNFDRLLMFGFFFWVWEYIRFLFVWQDVPMFIWDK